MTHLGEELLITAARGQQLPPAAVAHLEGCPACGDRLVAWRRVVAAARQTQAASGSVAVPAFDALVAPALAARSASSEVVPVVAPRVGRSWRISAAVAGWQVRLLPRSLAVVIAAGLVAGIVLAQAVPSGWGIRVFADLVALVALTGAVGVAGRRADPRGELWVTLPVGPAAVFWSRLLVVLTGVLAAALVASAVLFAAGSPGGFAVLVAAWLGPALLSAGVALLGSVWRGPLAGGLAAAAVWALGSVATAPSGRVHVGLGAVAKDVWATTPGTVLVAVLLLAAAGLLAGVRREPPAALSGVG